MYGVLDEVSLFWTDMEASTSFFTENTVIIDEKSPQSFVYWCKNLTTTRCIRALEICCLNPP